MPPLFSSKEIGFKRMKFSASAIKYRVAMGIIGAGLLVLVGFAVYSAATAIDLIFGQTAPDFSQKPKFNLEEARTLIKSVSFPAGSAP